MGSGGSPTYRDEATAADTTDWDAEAAAYDDAPDHGLADPVIREAWRGLLLEELPPAPARVADLGCGTGTLAALLAEAGYAVDGVDSSPAMVERARDKTAHLPEVSIGLGDAAAPVLPRAAYDVVLCRHLLWALPDPVSALRRWATLLRPGGRIVLVEGRWWTGSGLDAQQTLALAGEAGLSTALRPLADAAYWGGEIDHERYLVTCRPRDDGRA
jgi:SAM-dependent methyltransferase